MSIQTWIDSQHERGTLVDHTGNMRDKNNAPWFEFAGQDDISRNGPHVESRGGEPLGGNTATCVQRVTPGSNPGHGVAPDLYDADRQTETKSCWDDPKHPDFVPKHKWDWEETV